jgi:hypothetical protein
MRRALLIPLKRWQASTEQQQLADTLEEDDHCSVLLMQGLSSNSNTNANGGSGNRGKNRGVGRAIAGARAAVGGCAGDSKATWQQLSKVFA